MKLPWPLLHDRDQNRDHVIAFLFCGTFILLQLVSLFLPQVEYLEDNINDHQSDIVEMMEGRENTDTIDLQVQLLVKNWDRFRSVLLYNIIDLFLFQRVHLMSLLGL